MRPSLAIVAMGVSHVTLLQDPVVVGFSVGQTTSWPHRRIRSTLIRRKRIHFSRANYMSSSSSSSSLFTVNNNLIISEDGSASSANVNGESLLTSRQEAASSHLDTEGLSTEDLLVPSYKQLLVFLFTTILIWLSEPVLSLVDTTVVGSLTSKSAITQLAAIGPATTLYDSLLYMTYFLAIATTNKITKANAGNKKDFRYLQTIMSHVLGVAGILGILATIFCYTCGSRVLHSMVVGPSLVATPAQQLLLHHATRYTMIRASVSVASIMGMVMQAFCLAVFDTRTPILAVLAASVVNVTGDLLLRPWGVQGAAIATALASLLSTFILFGSVKKTMNKWRRLEMKENAKTATMNKPELSLDQSLEHNTTSTVPASAEPPSLSSTETASSTEARRPVPLMSLPDRRSFVELVKLSGPIFLVILAKIACYGAMTLRATDFGVVPLATHNIMMRIFFFYGTFGDAISQTAQTYLPATLYPQPDTKSFNKILKRLLVMAAILSVVNSQACIFILKNCGQFLVSDERIVNLMSQNTGYLGLAILLHPFILFLEGTVIASRDFRTLIMTYVATLGLHFSVLNYFCGSFPSVWRTFFVFQVIRAVSFSWNVWRRQCAIKREENERLELSTVPTAIVG